MSLHIAAAPIVMTNTTGGNAKKLNLSGSWTKFWTTVTGNMPDGFFTILSIAGMLIVLGALIGYIMKRRNGGGGGGLQAGTPIFWALIIGLLCLTPSVILPALLKVLDGLGNVILGFLGML